MEEELISSPASEKLSIPENYTDPMKSVSNSYGLTDANDVLKIYNIIQRRINGETFDYYEAFPDILKKQVDEVLEANKFKSNKKNQLNKRYISKTIMDKMVEEYMVENRDQYDLEKLIFNFSKGSPEISNNISAEMSTMMLSIREETQKHLDEAIKKCEDEGNTKEAERFKKIKNAVDEAYYLDKFAEFCKTCKIKNFDLVKPSRHYDCFNLKYERNKNTINDIRGCPLILTSHFPQYKSEYITMLMVAFCKYCENMSPDNLDEHAFMYYFIHNISIINRIKPKNKNYESIEGMYKDFYDGFIFSLNQCISNLLLKNVTLQ